MLTWGLLVWAINYITEETNKKKIKKSIGITTNATLDVYKRQELILVFRTNRSSVSDEFYISRSGKRLPEKSKHFYNR